MQKKLISILFLFVFGACGCKKIKELTQFHMDYHETVVIAATHGINLPFNILTPEITSNAESTFSIHDTRKDLINEIVLESLVLTLLSPEDKTFSFLKSIGIYINADGLSEEKVAWRENISSDKKLIELETTGKDLKEYIKKDEFTLRLNTVTKEYITQDHHIDIHSVFWVDAKLIGAK